MDSGGRAILTSRLLAKVESLGVTGAGIAGVAKLKKAPSYESRTTVDWPDEAKSLLVLCLLHDPSVPQLDWWDDRPGGTPGNREMIRIAETLKAWLHKEFRINAQPLPYYVDKGGVFLKDAAVLAGLGVIGENNLLITPEFGPRVRLRGVFLDVHLDLTGPRDFDPCNNCDQPCRGACPQQAFQTGSYDRDACWVQMEKDKADREIFERPETSDSPAKLIRYCRHCELACPIGHGDFGF